jgi:flavin-dependent dehydrogenase
VVIGGGLAGGAVATRLARAGQAVTVLEREAGPHEKVCGEFLSVEACRDLERLGLDPQRLGAVPIDRVRVHHGRRTAEAPLPFLARSLSRATLDAALLEMAADAGAEVVRGVRVTGIDGTRVLASDGERRAGHVLLATGKHDLRGFSRTAPATREGYVGFKMHWRLRDAAIAELGSAIDLVLFDGGYAGLQRLGETSANLCLVVKRSRFAELGSTWNALLAALLREPALARRLGDAQPLLAKPLTIANLPYGYVHQPSDDAVWRLGDQAAMTASLSGDGMAGALRSAHLAADCLTRGASVAQFHRLVGAQIGGQVRRAMALQRAAERPLALRLGTALAIAWPRLLTLGARLTRLPAYVALA